MSRCTTTAASAGEVFYASPQQPSIPESLRDGVAGVRLGSWATLPHHTSRPSILPLDVPDGD